MKIKKGFVVRIVGGDKGVIATLRAQHIHNDRGIGASGMMYR